MSIVIAILVLSFLIIIHELGHFAAAKSLGVKVIEFSLFMGPRLLSVTMGETRYSIKLIPVGGSCVMEGEESLSTDSRALNHKPKWAQAIIFAAGPFMNVLFALVLLLVINFAGGYMTNTISAVKEGSSAAQASTPLAAGDTIVKYAGRAISVPIEIFIHLQDTKGAPVEIEFLRGGVKQKTVIKPEFTPGKRYILGFNGVQSYGPDWNLVAKVGEGDPADLLGISGGDRIMTVNGKAPKDREELRDILAEPSGAAVDIVWVKPDGSTQAGSIAPKFIDDQDSYSLGIVHTYIERPSLIGGIIFSINNAVSYSKMVLYSLKWMVTGTVGLNQVSGPVGIVAEIGSGLEETAKSENAAAASFVFLMNLSALIGINLGLFNLIPFPPLDGSKLLILGVEAVRRKNIPLKRQMAISMFGFFVLIALMILTLFNDVGRIIAK